MKAIFFHANLVIIAEWTVFFLSLQHFLKALDQVTQVIVNDVSARETCHSRHLEDCLLLLGKFAAENPSPFPSNEQELNKQCNILGEFRGCMYNYSTNCMGIIARSIGGIFVGKTNEDLKSLCTDGDELRKMYLNNMECIGEHYKGVTPCLKRSFAGLEVLPGFPPKQRQTAFCCGLNQLRRCVRLHYESNCNEDVATLAETIIEFGTTDMTTQLCEALESMGKCPTLPPFGTALTGAYKDNLFGKILDHFVRE